MLLHPERIFERYISGAVASIQPINTSQSDADRRFTYLVASDAGERLVFKFSNNCFTTPERIGGWRYLADLYNDCGVYAPRILTDRDGRFWHAYTEDGVQYFAYAEEQKKYRTAAECGLGSDISSYFEDMVRAEAKIARRSTKLPAWKSAWCLYDRFCADDETDETYYWQREFYQLVRAGMPALSARAEWIWQRFLSLYATLEPQYRALPQAFFQGDEGGTNTMLDESGRYAGVLDFNLSGAETILNYFFRSFCRVPIRAAELDRLSDRALLDAKDEALRARLRVVKKHYAFSEVERAAFPLYYNTVYPLECDLCQQFQRVIRAGDARRAAVVLDWIEYQQTRSDMIL